MSRKSKNTIRPAFGRVEQYAPPDGNPANFRLTRASLLDVPLIFDLMMSGSETGSFTDTYMKGAGWLRLFIHISRGVFASDPKLEIIRHGPEQIGFLQTTFETSTDGLLTTWVLLMGVIPEYRNCGHATAVLNLLMNNQRPGATIMVHTTKYARAMQRVLKNLHFMRHPCPVVGLEEYRWICPQAGFGARGEIGAEVPA